MLYAIGCPLFFIIVLDEKSFEAWMAILPLSSLSGASRMKSSSENSYARCTLSL